MKIILAVILLISLLVLIFFPKKDNQDSTSYPFDLDPAPVPKQTDEQSSIEFVTDKGDEDSQETSFFDLTFYRKTVHSCLDALFSPHHTPPPPPVYPPLEKNLEKAIAEQIQKMEQFKQGYRLMKIVDDPNSNIRQISSLVTKDPVLSAQILRVSNSPFFGVKDQIQSIHHAIMLIGLLNLKKLISYQAIFQGMTSKDPQEQLIYLSLWEHVSLTALLANYLAGGLENTSPGTMFTMGLLHDIGKFVISQLSHDYFFKQSSLIPCFEELSLEQEIEHFGVSHPQIGMFCCQSWELPQGIISIVAQHHSLAYPPTQYIKKHTGLDQYLVGVHIANCLANLLLSKEKQTPLPLHPDFQQTADKKRLQTVLSDPTIFAEILKSQAVHKETQSNEQ